MIDQTSRDLLELYRAGDSRATAEIFDRYVGRLVELARRRISPKLARRIDPEDVVQSAYRSFFVHARDGEFVLERSGDLWRLLTGITLNKLYGQVERHTAARRALGREEPAGADVGLLARAPSPTPAEAACLNELLAQTMQGLDPVQRQAFEMRLKANTTEEISNTIGRSQRTVRRWLETIRRNMEQQLGDD